METMVSTFGLFAFVSALGEVIYVYIRNFLYNEMWIILKYVMMA